MCFRNLSFIFLFMCLGSIAFAQAPSSKSNAATPHHEPGMMMPMMGMASDQQIDQSLNTLQRTLDLSSSQVSSIRQLAQNRRDEMKSIREQSRPKFQQLMTLLNQPNPDPAAVGRATIELKAVHDQAKAKRAEMDKKLDTILNPTQQQKVNQLRNEAETFMALRRLGLIEPAFMHGMQSSGTNPTGAETGHDEY
jgi:Spy/CpxP family protein refolding chaperone